MILRKAVLLVASIVFALLIAEAGLRLVGFDYQNFFAYDDHTGNTHRPGARGWWRDEGESFVEINSNGLRDIERPTMKPAGAFRVAVLGDSYAEAFQVPREQSFPAVIERQLAGCAPFTGRKLEVINFGVSGYGTAQELQALRYRVWPYQPDAVVLAITTGNDLRDNSKALGASPRPFFRLQDGQLVLDDSFRNTLGYRIKTSRPYLLYWTASSHSRVLQLVNRVKDGWSNRSSAASRRDTNTIQEPGLDDEVLRPPATPEWKEAWDLEGALIRQFHVEVRQHGARLLVAVLSSGIQVHPNAGVRQAFMDRMKIAGLFYPDERLKTFMDRSQIPNLILAPRLQAIAETQHLFLHGFPQNIPGQGHWNAEGHRLGGGMIADAICADASQLQGAQLTQQ